MQRNTTAFDLSNKNLRLTIFLGVAILIIVLLIVVLTSSEDKDPVVKNLDKTHSIAVTYETKLLPDSTVLLIAHQNVYVKGKLIQAIIRRDTLPALGDSLQTVDDNETERMVRIPKEYEFFVTIK